MLFFSVSCQPKYSKYKLKKFGLARNSWWNILGLHSTTFPEDLLWEAGNVKRSWLKCKSGGSLGARRLGSESTLSDPQPHHGHLGCGWDMATCVLIIYIWATANFPYYNSLLCMCTLSPLFVFDSLQPMDYSLPGSFVCEIFQARILEWVAMPSFRESSRSRDQTHISCVSCIGRWILFHCTTWEELRAGLATDSTSKSFYTSHGQTLLPQEPRFLWCYLKL